MLQLVSDFLQYIGKTLMETSVYTLLKLLQEEQASKEVHEHAPHHLCVEFTASVIISGFFTRIC